MFLTPKVDRISPIYGPMFGGTTIVIYGEHLSIGSNVSITIGDSICRMVFLLFSDISLIETAHLFSNLYFILISKKSSLEIRFICGLYTRNVSIAF